MLQRISSFLLSMRFMSILVLLFFVSVAYATFIENDFGTQTAKALVYNAKWFEWLMALLCLNMIANINRYKLWRKEKWPSLIFHLSFVLIAIGAGVTRYISYEGMMHIREGEKSNQIVSDGTFLQIKVHDEKLQYVYDKPLLLHNYEGPFSFLKDNHFEHDVNFQNHDVQLNYIDYVPNAKDTMIVGEGKPTLHIVMAGTNGRENFYLQEGSAQRFMGVDFSFGKVLAGYISFIRVDGELMIQSPMEGSFMRMADRQMGSVVADSLQPLMLRSLYQIMGQSIVIPAFHEAAKLAYLPGENPEGQELEDVLVLEVQANGERQEVNLFGDKGFVSMKKRLQLGGLHFELAYGSKHYTTPFYVQLNDFQLERYPGSMSPSSFASEVTLMDGSLEEEHRIYMNNVLDYKGYRFFQSSYDQDELGTVLSVNHDFWGTLLSYLGYFLMTLGMVASLFVKNSRFAFLRQKLNDLRGKRAMTVLLFLFGTLSISAQNIDSLIQAQAVPVEQADAFGRLLVQDQGGRMKPVNTLASEVLRKVSRKSDYNGLSPNQVLLGMAQNPYAWQLAPMIKVKNEQLQEQLGISSDYTSFLSFFSNEAKYVLTEEVEKAYAKKPAERSKYDKEVIAVDERVNVSYMVYKGSFFRFFPLPNDVENSWLAANEANQGFQGDDSLFVYSILPIYYQSIQQSLKSDDWTVPSNTLSAIKKYQQKFGAAVIPSDTKIDLEIFYNKAQLFKKLSYFYGLIGVLMLFLLIMQVLKERKGLRLLIRIGFYLLFLGFLVHTFGLISRWFISGHAPWSDAYESMIYIAWATILAGYVFAKKSMMSMAATAVLSSLLLTVASLNWLDPEITNLVPVLDSYWLMIHVAIITASYGFLALGALLGFLNLILMILQSQTNRSRISSSLKELTYINEMSLTIGLFMLSVGTFLGGIWANESWGRYWGWDPKETWAFASMLVYIFVLHMRFIPKLKGMFAFNLASLIAYSSIIMTYFGVNFYLSGLHSYAAGDPMPVPNFVYYSIVVVSIVASVAYIRNQRFKK